ncbi:MAG: glycosyltransferase [Dongiaceae bacterium]
MSAAAAAAQRRRVAFFLQDLSGGGAERVMVRLANGMAAAGLDVVMLLVRREGPLLDVLSPAVRVEASPGRRTLWSTPWLVGQLRRERPDALLSALPHINLIAILAARLAGHRARIVPTQHNERKAWDDPAFPLIRIAYRLGPLLYPLADNVVAVSGGVAASLSWPPWLARKVRVIHNPIVEPTLPALAAAPCAHPWLAPGQPPVLLAVGRLAPAKDFATLLQALDLVRRERPVRLIILGEGSQRPELERLRAKLGLEAAADLPGWVENPFALMSRAALLVQSSVYEGLPTVLVEALACGTPVVATHCSAGSAEILGDGRYGRLVPMRDPAALAAAVLAALAEPAPVELLRQRAQEFTVERAVARYRALLFGEE